ncbi:MAG TPA: hypothetical protein VH161_05160, partial [Candidatus Acidoferrales bacterium]|nr:hypothetical protein [Candidatus Acidoferrales bacterium]
TWRINSGRESTVQPGRKIEAPGFHGKGPVIAIPAGFDLIFPAILHVSYNGGSNRSGALHDNE